MGPGGWAGFGETGLWVSCRSCSQTPSSSWTEPPARTSAREPWVGPSGSWVFFPQEFPLPIPSGSAPTPPSCKLRQALAARAGAGSPRFLGLFCKLRGRPPRDPWFSPAWGSRSDGVSHPRGLLAPGCHRLSHPQRHPPAPSGSARPELPGRLRRHLPFPGEMQGAG